MPKRMIDTELWNNEDIIENFTAEDRYFWLYLLTSPHNNICGVFKNSPALIARDMGLHKDTIINLLYRFENVHGLIYVDRETNEILILNWYKFNWTSSPKILSLLKKEKKSIKSSKIIALIDERINFLFQNNEEVENDDIVDTVSIPYEYPSNTITNSIPITETITDIEDEERKKEDIYKSSSSSKKKVKSHAEIMQEWEIDDSLRYELEEFLRHCHLNGRTVTNDKLNDIILRLYDYYGGGDIDGMCEAVRIAVRGGYFDIAEYHRKNN